MLKDNQSELIKHLVENETLLWAGQPIKGIVFRTADIFLIPSSLLRCGFAIFWFISASQVGGIFALFEIPFVIIGLLFVFGRFIIEAKQRDHTFYGITKEIIIIKSGVFSKNIKSISIKNLSGIEYTEKNDGSGTIYTFVRI